jgi:hypothetical protein
MGNSVSIGKQPSQEEIRETRQARQSYLTYLSTVQVNVNTEVSGKRLTPDTGNLILEKIKAGNAWLQKNPNANYNEIVTNYDATNTEIKRLLDTDKPKKEMLNQILTLKGQARNWRITPEEAEKLVALADETKKWYDKNNKTATTIDYSQEQLKFKDSIRKIIPDVATSNDIISMLNSVKDMDPTDLMASIQKTDKEIEIKKSQTFDFKEGATVAWVKANQVFWSLLLIFLCFVSGSLAANNAIGRARAYRVLYFFYGLIPFYAPIVLLYTIYRRIREGPLPYYAPLPLSIDPATTRLGKILWFPFYWIPDNIAVDEYEKYQQSLKDMITT